MPPPEQQNEQAVTTAQPSPPVPAMPERVVTSQTDDDEIDLRFYWHIFTKYKWKIFGLTLLIGLLTTLVVFSLQPIYRSTALLLIESDKTNIISFEDIYGMSSFKKEYYQTQLEILQSRGLAEKVVNKLNLISHPTFDPKQQKNWILFELA